MRARFVALAAALVTAVTVLPLAAQEPGSSGSAQRAAPAAGRRALDPSRRLPNFFGQLGLTPQQRESVYKIVGKHQEKISGLEKQMAEARAEMLKECETVLTDSQRQLLSQRRGMPVSARERPARSAASAPATKVAGH